MELVSAQSIEALKVFYLALSAADKATVSQTAQTVFLRNQPNGFLLILIKTNNKPVIKKMILLVAILIKKMIPLVTILIKKVIPLVTTLMLNALQGIL